MILGAAAYVIDLVRKLQIAPSYEKGALLINKKRAKNRKIIYVGG
jgi:hypothetical protein